MRCRKKTKRAVAELIRFYGIQPSELAQLGEIDILGLRLAMPAIAARQRLELQSDLLIVMADPKDRMAAQLKLAEAAAEDDETFARMAQSITGMSD